MSASTLYFIRHGETDWNASGRYQGSQDIPLNATGRGQASTAGIILRDLLARDGRDPRDLHFVASPLGRARATMELLRAEIGLEAGGYHLDARLREISFGDWEGLTTVEMAQHNAAHFEARTRDRWGVAAPAGESYAELAERVGAWHADLAGDVVAVGHGGTMRGLMVARGVATPDTAVDHLVQQGAVYVFSATGMAKYA